MINLATVETRTQEKAAGATTPDPATVKGKLVEFALWLSKQGYDEDVAKWRSTVMKRLIDLGANLWNPETVKEVLAKQKSWSDSYKMVLVYAYENFLKMEGLSWNRPKYKQCEVFPFIPTEAELDQLIAACGKKIGTFLHGLKDTGADPGELATLRWTDINIESRAVQLRPVKGHRPRVLTASQQFIDRIQLLPKTSERVFGGVHGLIGAFIRQRRRAASKFANPRFLSISFRTFRHWKATIEYHRTKDILYVQKMLGHRQIRNTLKYIDLEANIFKTTDDQFFAKVATNVQEAIALIETGFEYVTGDYDDGGKIFRKRK
jgi:integrase